MIKQGKVNYITAAMHSNHTVIAVRLCAVWTTYMMMVYIDKFAYVCTWSFKMFRYHSSAYFSG